MKSILALDQGSRVSRAVVFDEHADVIASAERDTQVVRPTRDRVEQDAVATLNGLLSAAVEALRRAEDAALAVAAIGIAGQRDAMLIWDVRTGEPVGNAIVGHDTRAAAACRALVDADFEIAIARRTGLPIAPRFAGPRLSWLLDSDPQLRRRAEAGEIAFGTIDSWLVWNLTGGAEHLTDASSAATTALYSIQRHAWDERALGIFGIPSAVLGTVVPSAGLVATIAARDHPLDRVAPGLHAGLRNLLHALPPGVPITGMATERHAALIGQGCLAPGSVNATYTEDHACIVLQNTGTSATPSRARLLTSLAWHTPPLHSEPRDPFDDDELLPVFEVETWDRTRGWVTSTEAVMLKDAPVIAPDPAFVYVLEGDASTDGVRDQVAAGEALASQVADVIAAMQAETGIATGTIHVDGEASMDDAAMQLQADLIGVALVRPASPATAALGAATLAGVAAEVWPDSDAVAALRKPGTVFRPALDEGARKRQRPPRA